MLACVELSYLDACRQRKLASSAANACSLHVLWHSVSAYPITSNFRPKKITTHKQARNNYVFELYKRWPALGLVLFLPASPPWALRTTRRLAAVFPGRRLGEVSRACSAFGSR
jgi:hypothetical protein